MGDEKPLHVQVAEALGWTNIEEAPVVDQEASARAGRPIVSGSQWFGSAPPDCPKWGPLVRLNLASGASASYSMPRYDTDWSATGPLIEKYGITVLADYGHYDGWWIGKPVWRAMAGAYDDLQFGDHGSAIGATPLEAVCFLILALHEAGKLKAA